MSHRNWTRHELERFVDGDLPASDARMIEQDLARDTRFRSRVAAVRSLDDAIMNALHPQDAPAQKPSRTFERATEALPRTERRPARRSAAPLKSILLAAASILIVIGAGMYFTPRAQPERQPDGLRAEAPWQTPRSASQRRFSAAPLNVSLASRVRIAPEPDERKLPRHAPLRVSSPSLLAPRRAADTAEASPRTTIAVRSTADARALFEGLSTTERITAAELLMRNPGLRSVAFRELARLREDHASDRQIDDLVRRMEEDPELRTWAVAYQLSRSNAHPPRTLPNGT